MKLDLFGIVTPDMRASLEFYGRLGLDVPTGAADEKYAELSALGHGHKEPWDAPRGRRYAVVRDPDGNHVDLFAAL